MTNIEQLQESLIRQFPGIGTNIDPPLDRQQGVWCLDIEREGATPIVVEWRVDRGFGISTIEDESAFGVRPDEIYEDIDTALERISSLIQSGGPSVHPLSVRLAELRRDCGLTQAELAERAGVKQANISRIEHRNDTMISTLNRIARALGGQLSVRIVFPDGDDRELMPAVSLQPHRGRRTNTKKT